MRRRGRGCTRRTITWAACPRSGSGAWRGWSMSSSIWTRCAGASELRPLRLEPWRVVEAQHRVSTRKLVDTLEEQALLEDLIERAKPPDPTGGRLHYLLATPFRDRKSTRLNSSHVKISYAVFCLKK